MARYTGPKLKLSRRLGIDIGLKSNPAKVQRRLATPPGQHGPKGNMSKKSDYGIQLQEKQKVKWMYGIMEKQMRKYMAKAERSEEASGKKMLQFLEMRLDNVVYRLGMAPTRAAARQLVNHGHVKINGKKVSIPSYQVKLNDVVSFSDKAVKIPAIKDMIEQKLTPPSWLDKKANVGKVINFPAREDSDSHIKEDLIVEFYSR